MDTLELKDALLLDPAEMMCAVHEQVRRHHPVTYKEFGPSLFGSGSDTNISTAFGFQTPEDEESFNEVTRKIEEAISALELSEVVTVHKVLVRDQISGSKKSYPAEYEVTVAVVE